MNKGKAIKELSDVLTASLDETKRDYKADLKILPDVKILKIGGQSITDRGRKAMFPVLEEIVKNKDNHAYLSHRHRSWHAYWGAG